VREATSDPRPKPLPTAPWPATWFTRTRGYQLFMLREVTSVFVAGYLVFLLVLLHRAGRGPEAYEALMATLRSPLPLVLHGLALLAAVYHSITWFNISPRIMPARIGEDRLPDAFVSVGGGFLPWAMISLAIAWVMLR
jgi:fumarate reductase subunit C